MGWRGPAGRGLHLCARARAEQYADDILKGFTGVLQGEAGQQTVRGTVCPTNGYAGYNRLIQPERTGPAIQPPCVREVARRKLYEVAKNSTAPIAEDGLKRIAELYKIEAEIRGLPPEARLAIRQDRSASKIAGLKTWLTHQRARVSAKFPLGEALKYIAKYWAGLCLFIANGRIEMDNNAVERTIRPIALNRKNALFAGHDAGAENWATIASLVETCKLNAVEPHAYLTAIVNGHKQSQIDDLLPWNYAAKV